MGIWTNKLKCGSLRTQGEHCRYMVCEIVWSDAVLLLRVSQTFDSEQLGLIFRAIGSNQRRECDALLLGYQQLICGKYSDTLLELVIIYDYDIELYTFVQSLLYIDSRDMLVFTVYFSTCQKMRFYNGRGCEILQDKHSFSYLQRLTFYIE